MSLPYFPLYPKDFRAATPHLSRAEKGAYFDLLCLCWVNHKCSIPADSQWIRRHLVATEEEYDLVIKPVLDEFFKASGRAGSRRFTNKKLSEIFVQQSAKHKARVEAGKKGGSANSLKNNNKKSSKAQAKLKQPEPEPKPLKIKNKNGEWVLAAIPDEGTKARALCDQMLNDFGQSVWARWFNGKMVAFDGDEVRPLSPVAHDRLSQKYIQRIEGVGMTLGDVWSEGAAA